MLRRELVLADAPIKSIRQRYNQKCKGVSYETIVV